MVTITLDEETMEDIAFYKSYPMLDSALRHLGQDLIRLYKQQGGK